MIDLERVRTLAERFFSEGFVANEREAVRYAIQVLAAADALPRPESATEARHLDHDHTSADDGLPADEHERQRGS